MSRTNQKFRDVEHDPAVSEAEDHYVPSLSIFDSNGKIFDWRKEKDVPKRDRYVTVEVLKIILKSSREGVTIASLTKSIWDIDPDEVIERYVTIGRLRNRVTTLLSENPQEFERVKPGFWKLKKN